MAIMKQIKLAMRSTKTVDNEIASKANTTNTICNMISNMLEQITYGAAGVEPGAAGVELLLLMSPMSLMERLPTSGKKSSSEK
jgi:hypothetical protein